MLSVFLTKMEDEGIKGREGRPAINLLVAVEQSGGMGREGGLPWSLAREWQHFLALATRWDMGWGMSRCNVKLQQCQGAGTVFR